ncbi:hypothetical protein AncyloWKF20_08680 [Ancylobacter sp. WKF20]|uniref:hypothetical protein n=1 Tax=Ancylobacter sp. WKF20 TaxID=3039801 RepID=UPI00243447B9|nr:hypothetical protein [Ancylobacter sp. WKF20]WGD31878.1 hypothetical protein AncyloWKF20_08680 [Ancylobacter sp. WKF20]
MLIIGLVAEGTHDFIMLDPFIRQELEARTGQPVKFKALQPMQDQTGAMTSGGWSRVVAWCKSNAGSRIDTFFEPIFEGDEVCSAIVVHLDGDALELIGSHTTVAIPLPVNDVATRVSLLVEILENLLAASDLRRSMLAFALPVLQTEAWVLDAEGSASNCETLDAKAEFRKNYGPRERIVHRYQERAQGIQGSASAENCLSFQHFKSELRKLPL